MAKKIKFPLEMKDGVMVRTLEELQENFDVEKLLGHWLSGKLQVWLSDRRYNQYLEKVNAINSASNTAVSELCAVLGIENGKDIINVEIEKMSKRQEKIKIIRQYTDEKEILDYIDNVVMDQIELDELLRRNCGKIYLFGKSFHIAEDTINTSFYGINKPKIFIKSAEGIDFSLQGIDFYNCEFDVQCISFHKKNRTQIKFYHSEISNDGKKLYDILQKRVEIVEENNKVQNIFELLVRLQNERFDPTYFDWESKNPLMLIIQDSAYEACTDIILKSTFNKHSYPYKTVIMDNTDKEASVRFTTICKQMVQISYHIKPEYNPMYQFAFWAIVILFVDERIYIEKVSLIADILFLLGFTEDLLNEWINKVNKFLQGEIIELDEVGANSKIGG